MKYSKPYYFFKWWMPYLFSGIVVGMREWMHRNDAGLVVHHSRPSTETYFTEKCDLSRYPVSWLSKKLSRKVSSGGTTGTPVVFFEYLWVHFVEMCYIAQIFRMAGWSPRKRTVVFRGDRTGKLITHYGNMMVVSSYDIEDNVAEIAESIRAFNPVWCYAYPSVLQAFLNHPDISESLRGLSGFLFGSEKLYPGQLANIREKYSNPTVVEWYGLSEKAALLYRISPAKTFSYFKSYASVDCFPVDDSAYELVGTSKFQGPSRVESYRTFDYVLVDHKRQITEITGRKQDWVYVDHDTKIPISQGIGNLHGNVWSGVKTWRIEQRVIGSLIIHIEAKEGFSLDLIRERFSNAFSEYIKRGVAIEVRFGKVKIHRSPAGKARYFEQFVN